MLRDLSLRRESHNYGKRVRGSENANLHADSATSAVNLAKKAHDSAKDSTQTALDSTTNLTHDSARDSANFTSDSTANRTDSAPQIPQNVLDSTTFATQITQDSARDSTKDSTQSAQIFTTNNAQDSAKSTDSATIPQAQAEQRVLEISMMTSFLLAAFGMCFGLVIGSRTIVFDGFVSLMAVGLSWLSVVTSRYIYKEDDDTFQYGYVRFEPMVNLFKALVLVLVCVYAFVNAIGEIAHGGYEIKLGSAVIYTICAFIFCFIVYAYTGIYAKKLESDLIKVDNVEWGVDCVLYLGAIIAFGAIYLAHLDIVLGTFPSLEPLLTQTLPRYIDPALLCVLSLMLCISPIRICIANFKDLMMVAPKELDEKITEIMEDLSNEYGFKDYDTHVAKSGRFFMVEVNILMQNFILRSVDDFDKIRAKIEKDLEIPSYKIWLSVSFTGNPKWL